MPNLISPNEEGVFCSTGGGIAVESPSKRPKPGALVNGDNDSKAHRSSITGLVVVAPSSISQDPALIEQQPAPPQHPQQESQAALPAPQEANKAEDGAPAEPATIVSPGHLTRVRVGMTLRHWTITSRIGAGSFGETFVGQDKGDSAEGAKFERGLSDGDADSTPQSAKPRPQEVCIKVEQESKNVLRVEVLALKRVQQCPQVVRYVASGRFMDANYLVMERLGLNLVDVRRLCPRGVFTIHTTLRVGISCLKAIQGVHELGLVHRDIKPSNFVIGLKGEAIRTCYLIDFGLARRYRRSNGEVRPARDETGFRGTSRYASLQSHRHQDLGRVDDLWSLLFMLIEFATGTLPWRKFKDKDDIGRCKELCIGPQLVKHMPREFGPFLEHLESCSYASEPDYSFLLSLLYRSLERRGYPPNKPLEWEELLAVDGENAVCREAGQEDSAPKGEATPPVAMAAPSSHRATQAASSAHQPQPLFPKEKDYENNLPQPEEAAGEPFEDAEPIEQEEGDAPATKLVLAPVPGPEEGPTDRKSTYLSTVPAQQLHTTTGTSLKPPLMAPSLSPEPLSLARAVPLRMSDETPMAARASVDGVEGEGCWAEDGSQSRPEVRTKITLHVEQVEMKLGRALQNGRSPDSSNVFQFSAAPAADNPLSARKHEGGTQGAAGDGREGGGSSTNSTSKSAFSPRCQVGASSGTGAGELQLVDDEQDDDDLHPHANQGHSKTRAPPTQLRPPTAALHQSARTLGSDHNEMNELSPAGPTARARDTNQSGGPPTNATTTTTRSGKRSTNEETTMCSCMLM